MDTIDLVTFLTLLSNPTDHLLRLIFSQEEINRIHAIYMAAHGTNNGPTDLMALVCASMLSHVLALEPNARAVYSNLMQTHDGRVRFFSLLAQTARQILPMNSIELSEGSQLECWPRHVNIDMLTVVLSRELPNNAVLHPAITALYVLHCSTQLPALMPVALNIFCLEGVECGEHLPASLFERPTLTVLRITHSSVQINLSDVCRLVNLRVLDLSGSRITHVTNEISALAQLEELDLSYCDDLEMISFAGLRELGQLRSVNITESSIDINNVPADMQAIFI